MGQKATANKRNAVESKERLLQAGIKLFAEYGPDATTVEMIAKEARINRRMLYHYFESKEGLYRATIQRAYEQSAAAEIELAHLLLPVEELFERIVRSHYEFLSAHPEFVRLLAWENLRYGRTAREIDVSALKAPMIQAFHLAVEQGKREGLFRPDIDEKQLLISHMGLCFFYFSNQYTLSQMLGLDMTSKQAIQKRIKHVSRLMLDGIRHNGPENSRRAKK